MRKLKIIGITITATLLLTIGHLKYGLFERFNFVTAYFDKWTGNERIIIYGEAFETDSIKIVTAPKLGFKYERLEDCTVTSSFVNGVTDYNKIMGQVISKRLGESWDERLEREILTLK